jgi:ATP-dependent DNA helicase RecG
MSLPLETSLADVPGAQRFLPKLKKIHIETVRDLLWHFPARYEDFSEVRPISELEPGELVTIQGTIEDVEVRRAWRKQMTIVEAWINDGRDTIRATWFNQPYLKDTLRPGRLANFSGKVSVSEEGEFYLAHPTYEFIAPGSEGHTKHTARLVPVYGETKGLTSKGIRFIVEPLLSRIDTSEWLPQELLERYDFPDLEDALKNIHYPAKLEDAEAARERFAFEELFLLQLALFRERARIAKTPSEKIPTDIEWLKSVLETLPFELTQSQKQALWDIVKDIALPHPMNRLLQGDVGSGKTAVAALGALIAAKHGVQAAFMAPTEILARQHFETIKKLFRKMPAGEQPAVGLLAAGEAKIFYENDLEGKITKSKFLEKVKKGELKILVGTHALIQKGVNFKNLSLVIVDEQHRFGVKQRAALLERRPSPHYLSMSATPIPRTLMLTVFGDLDSSRITELPSGRKEIKTEIIPPERRAGAYQFVREKIKEGRQAFVICPRIDLPDLEGKDLNDLSPMELAALEIKSVKAEFDRLSKDIFPDLRLAMLHGKMKPSEKDKVMNEFKAGKSDVLVATSVVEVGVDVPNAVIIMIESSDRFGLAQLYQFRGRVGRGEHQSYCFLMTETDAKTANERLKALVAAKNGFDLAEYDLALRGPGEFMGESQTGLPDVAMSSLKNPELVEETRCAAEEILAADPGFKKHPLLVAKLQEFHTRIHPE